MIYSRKVHNEIMRIAKFSQRTKEWCRSAKEEIKKDEDAFTVREAEYICRKAVDRKNISEGREEKA